MGPRGCFVQTPLALVLPVWAGRLSTLLDEEAPPGHVWQCVLTQRLIAGAIGCWQHNHAELSTCTLLAAPQRHTPAKLLSRHTYNNHT